MAFSAYSIVFGSNYSTYGPPCFSISFHHATMARTPNIIRNLKSSRLCPPAPVLTPQSSKNLSYYADNLQDFCGNLTSFLNDLEEAAGALLDREDRYVDDTEMKEYLEKHDELVIRMQELKKHMLDVGVH